MPSDSSLYVLQFELYTLRLR